MHDAMRVSLDRNPRIVIRAPMDESLIYVKTPKGTAEVALRVGGLSLQARRVLIMIDGARTLGELAPLLPDGSLDEVIELLQSRDMIRAMNEPEPENSTLRPYPDTRTPPGSSIEIGRPSGPPREPGGGSTMGTPPAEDRIYLTVDEVKRRAVHELNERLGPDAEAIAMRIERSTTAEELRERLREAERLVARTVSEASAREFVRAMRRR